MNKQQSFWQGFGGNGYITRNKYFHNFEYTDGYREDILKDFLSKIPKDSTVLELGCNKGQTIGHLKELGFTEVTGIDINRSALKIAREEFPQFEFIESSIEDYFREQPFDLVITSGVLIHIHPNNLKGIIDKICLLSKKYIFGFEYYSREFQDTNYGGKELCWSGNYVNIFNIKPQRMEIHAMKEKKKDTTHMFYLLKK